MEHLTVAFWTVLWLKTCGDKLVYTIFEQQFNLYSHGVCCRNVACGRVSTYKKKKEDKFINGNLKWPLHEKMIKAFSFPLNNSLNFDKGWPEDKQDSFASKLQTWNFAFWC